MAPALETDGAPHKTVRHFGFQEWAALESFRQTDIGVLGKMSRLSQHERERSVYCPERLVGRLFVIE